MDDNFRRSELREEELKARKDRQLRYEYVVKKCRLNPNQKKNLIATLKSGVKYLMPDNVYNIDSAEEQKRFVKGIEMCWSDHVVLVQYFREYLSDYVVLSKTQAAIKYATKLRGIITGYHLTSEVIRAIINDNRSTEAILKVESQLMSFLKDAKPQKLRISSYSEYKILIPGIVRVLSWYLGDSYFEKKSAKYEYYQEAVDIFYGIVSMVLNMLGLKRTLYSRHSTGERKINDRIMRTMRRTFREMLDSSKTHPVNILIGQSYDPTDLLP
jgi:hypothetical protein